MNLKIGNINIENNTCDKLPVIEVDEKPNFNEHLHNITKKANYRVGALSRISPFMDLTKSCFLMDFSLQNLITLILPERVIVEALITK